MEELRLEFEGLLATGGHVHTPCAGTDIKLTENYTKLLAQKLHRAFAKCVDNKLRIQSRNDNACVSKPKSVNEVLKPAEKPTISKAHTCVMQCYHAAILFTPVLLRTRAPGETLNQPLTLKLNLTLTSL